MRRFLIPFILTLALLPLSATANAYQQDWPSVTVNGHPGVVMPRDAAAKAVPWVVWPDDDIDGYWLPGQTWLEQAETTISEMFGGEEVPGATPAEFTPVSSEPLLPGYRQYAGYIEHGERKILINSFCREMGNWRSQFVIVMDGGSCFWNAVYNVDTGEIDHIYVNGAA